MMIDVVRGRRKCHTCGKSLYLGDVCLVYYERGELTRNLCYSCFFGLYIEFIKTIKEFKPSLTVTKDDGLKGR